MKSIKSRREELGFTQQTLSEATGLSLRTIQRFESGNKEPKGHSLNALAKAFNINPADLKRGFQPIENSKEDEQLSISFINLSALGFIIFPFGNILFPYLLWKRKRTSKATDKAGRKILNIQILWTLLLSMLLIIAPFLDNRLDDSMPLILIVLFSMMVINFIVILYTASLIRKDQLEFFNLPIRLI